ncbi:MAG: DUF1952 domain-containing protein [Anaerolineales bacterium]|uniref:DUF1952 domain-containing protein n=1 Tax=Candidatus Desulfolinea nitratireducens TaxID=2841698 RepID=A0A8J6NKA5_9CHLR|nr:DUF1952 domain-containing protein [Candidatus Desulfolinea nitratireducens]
MKTIIREMRGIPFFLLKEYLEEMGGKSLNENQVQGPGWTVDMSRMEPFKIGSLSIGQTLLEIQIEDHAVDDFLKVFGQKTLRAGG